jgi:hypothetical protein
LGLLGLRRLFGTHLGSLVSNSFFATDLPGEGLKKLQFSFSPGFKMLVLRQFHTSQLSTAALTNGYQKFCYLKN